MKVLGDKHQFDDLIKEAGNKLVVLDFYADWCGPCRMIAPAFEKMEAEHGDDVLFAKVNVDDNDELALECDVQAMPTFLFFKNGAKVDSVTGANEDKIRDCIMKNK